MPLSWLPPFIAGILNLLLCLLVLWHGPRKRLNQIFALFAFSLTSWNFDITALYFFTEYERALYWSEVLRYGMMFIAVTAYHVALALTGRWSHQNVILLWIGYIIVLLLCLANAAGLLVDRLYTTVWGYYPVGLPLYSVYSGYVLFYGPATVYQLIQGLRQSVSARQRQQLKIVLFGFAIGVPVALTNLLPVYGITFYPLGNLGNVLFCGALTYAIIRHRLLDVDLIITKTTASLIAIVLWLVPLWMLTTTVQKEIYGTSDSRLLFFALTVFILSGLVFPWLLRRTEAVASQLLWGQRYNTLQALSAFQKTIISILDQRQIIEHLRLVLTESLQTEFVSIYIRQSSTDRFEDPQDYQTTLEVEPTFARLLQHHEPLVREEVMLDEGDLDHQRTATTLENWQSEVCMPLHGQEQLIGFVLLGKKRSRDMYSAEDLRLLSALGVEVGVALDNARLYEELRTSQIMLARQDRLAAVGTLASGLAHEIRNPLVAIQTFTQLLPERIDDPEFRSTFLQITHGELERIATLVNDLMAFSRSSPEIVNEVQVNDLAQQVVRLLAGEAKKKGVTLTTQLSAVLPPMLIDPGQIKQVFMNLVLNALQATQEGGHVTVKTLVTNGTHKTRFGVIEVQDTGEGIPPDRREQIFDPFFTTKDSGTGLGLSITHQIVQEHGGAIEIESHMGQGTRFIARLPLPETPGIP